MSDIYNFCNDAEALQCIFKLMSFCLKLLLKIGVCTLLDIGSKDRCGCRPVIPKLSLLGTELSLVLLSLFGKLDVGLLLLRDIS